MLLTKALMCFSTAGWSSVYAVTYSGIEPLMQELPGYWQGEAIETPVGRMNYDMIIHTCDGGTVAGVAATGASLHYWLFMPGENDLHIRFLSTFRGNRSPRNLSLKEDNGASLSFHDPELKMLTLDMTLSVSNIDFRVFHYGKPHVHIRLTKANKSAFEPAPHHSRSNSCRGAPAEK